MIKEARGTGATISEAQEKARILLGADENDDVQFEIVKTAKKKVLGLFGGNDAEVRAYIEIPDKPASKKEKPQPKQKKNNEKPQNTAKNEKPKENKPAVEEKPEIPFVAESEISAESKTGKAIAYLRSILPSLGCENVSIMASENENGAVISVEGDGIGNLIGHRGETLDALQYLSSLAANNVGGYFKVSLNIGNYREKREQTLINLATRISKQVISSGKSRTLEPMNPYERRVIHTTVQAIEGVVSNSYGEGNNRRVVIYPEGSDMKPPRINGKGRRDGGRRGSSRDAGHKSVSSVVSSDPLREPKKDTDIPLYGKIN